MDSFKHITCGCGNPKKTSEFNTNTGESREICDICGYFCDVIIINKLQKNEPIPEGYKPKYSKEFGKTGFVIKVFTKVNKNNYLISCTPKNQLSKIIKQLNQDNNITKFGITFKDALGNYQTQIYK